MTTRTVGSVGALDSVTSIFGSWNFTTTGAVGSWLPTSDARASRVSAMHTEDQDRLMTVFLMNQKGVLNTWYTVPTGSLAIRFLNTHMLALHSAIAGANADFVI